MRTQIVIVDTNVLLHFQRLDDSRWATQFTAPCRFLIPATVISELDRHKHSATARLQRRARELLPWLEKNDGQPLREGFSLVLRATEPHRTLEQSPDLDSAHPDDRIVATAIEVHNEEPEADVVLLSADTAPRLKARHHQLAALAPSDDLRLPPTRTQEEQERDAALKRIQELEHRFPKLSLAVQGDSRTLAVGPSDEQQDLEARLQEALSQQAAEFGSICTQDYLDRYSDFFRESDALIQLASRCIRIPLEVRNAGTHHADDLLVEIEWSPPPRFREELPDPPRPPERPRPLMDFSRFLHRPFLDLPIPHIASRDAPSGPDGVPGGTSVTYRIPRLVHRTTVSLGELLLEFDSIETARGFSIRWSIHAAHQPEGATGELHFQVSPDRDFDGVLRLLGVDVDDEDAE